MSTKPQEENGGGEREGASDGESARAKSLQGMLHADDARVVSRLPKQLRKMMGVIVVVCAAFGLTVSEAKTEIICYSTKGMPEAITTFTVKKVAGQMRG